MISRSAIAWVPLVFAFAACGGSEPAPAPPPPPPPPAAEPPPAAVAPAASAAPAASSAPTAAPEPPPSTPAWRVAEGISTPESVLYDAAGDRYLVSNINGSPSGVDNNGYITEISADGKVTKPKFIEGGAGKVKLDAPKGSGIAGGVFYVTDITVVRKFDAKSGAPKGEIAIKDSVFLNDLAIAPDGRIFVSDSGMKAGEKGLEPVGGDAVYEIDKSGKVKTIAKMKELAGPNGLLLEGKKLIVVALGGDQAYSLSDKGEMQEVTHLPKGGLDGIAALGDGLLISSWQGNAIYKGKLGGSFEPVVRGVSGPADFGYDTKRSRVLVPRFTENAVEAYDVK
ncbi:MAG TPA: hypothetical protein VGQ57_03870 [Polyangiaceae bacterium]|jgi:hypothetical protein|nr:hypothetical protein [Polyangiaceae bacterium]